MSTDTAAAGMPHIVNKKDVLWGRQGLGASYFGEYLIAEAVWEVFEAAELDKLRNFVAFLHAFIGHAFSTLGKFADEYPEVNLRLGLTMRDIQRIMGVGTFGTRYGLAKRDGELVPERWVFSEEWDMITYACDKQRKTEPDHLPSEQVVTMSNFRVFLTHSKLLVVFACEWSTKDPQPKYYMPFTFTTNGINLRSVFDLTEEAMRELMKEVIYLSELLKNVVPIYDYANPQEKEKIIRAIFSELSFSHDTLQYKVKKGFETFDKRISSFCGSTQT